MKQTEDILIKGSDLTESQKAQLQYNGMKNPEWIKAHSFWFAADGKKSANPKHYYPVCHSLTWLPY